MEFGGEEVLCIELFDRRNTAVADIAAVVRVANAVDEPGSGAAILSARPDVTVDTKTKSTTWIHHTQSLIAV